MTNIHFSKYHGLGNDYLFLDAIRYPEYSSLNFPDLARAMSDRRPGPGSDGIVIFSKIDSRKFQMRIFNSDGSEAENCGNALRCIGRICRERNYTESLEFTVQTMGGPVLIKLEANDTEYQKIAVNMGHPIWEPDLIPVAIQGDPLRMELNVDDHIFDASCLSVGNPHCVLFVDNYNLETVTTLGPIVETHPLFPRKINAGFCRVVDEHTLDLTVWERGAGLTGACGTGATAAFAAAVRRNLVTGLCQVDMPGGSLSFQMDDQGNIYMIGPAEFSYEGIYPLS